MKTFKIAKIAFFTLFFFSFLNADNLPRQITLNDKDNKQENIVPTCTGYQCYINPQAGQPFTYTTTNGANGASSFQVYTSAIPQGQNPTGSRVIPVYISNLTLNQGSHLSFDGVNLQGNIITLNENTELTMRSNGDIQAENVNIKTGSNITTNSFYLFKDSSKMNIANSGKLNAATLRTEGELTNQGEIIINNDMLNIGYFDTNIIQTARTINSGTITINGSLYNGGELPSNTQIMGGGNFTIKSGGVVNVQDSVRNKWGANNFAQTPSVMTIERGGTMNVGNRFHNERGATLNIDGGTLKVSSGVINNGGTIKWSTGGGDTMGKIDGSLTNTGGTLQADITGANLDVEQVLVSGGFNGDQNLTLVNSQGNINDLVKYSSTSKGIVLSKAQAGGGGQTPGTGTGGQTPGGGGQTNPPGTGTGGQTPGTGGQIPINPNPNPSTGGQGGGQINPPSGGGQINPPSGGGSSGAIYDQMINANNNSGKILASIDKGVANLITYGGSEDLSNLAQDLDKNIQSLATSPFALVPQIGIVKDLAPQNRFAKNNLVRTAAILGDIYDTYIPQETMPNFAENNVSINAFGGTIKDKETRGFVAGANISNQVALSGSNILRTQLSFAKSQNKGDFSDISAKTNSDIFAFLLLDRQSFLGFELDSMLGLNYANVKTKRSSSLLGIQGDGSYNALIIDGGFNFGYRFENERASIKPYMQVGFGHFSRSSINESSAIGIKSDAFNRNYIELGLGISAQVPLGEFSFGYIDISHSRVIVSSKNEMNFTIGAGVDLIKYELPKDAITSVILGARFAFTQYFALNLEGIFRSYLHNGNYYGGRASVVFVF